MRKGPKHRCNNSGVWLYEDEMVRDPERPGWVKKGLELYPDDQLAPNNRSKFDGFYYRS